MTRATKCTICARADVDAIDKALRAERPLRAVAEQFDTTTSTLDRHKQHLSARRPSTARAPAVHDHASLAPALPSRMTTEQLISGIEAVVQQQFLRLASDTSLSESERSKMSASAVASLTHLAKLQGRTELSERKILASAAFNRLTEHAKRILMNAAAKPCPACGVVDLKWRAGTVMELGEGLMRLGEEQGP